MDDMGSTGTRDSEADQKLLKKPLGVPIFVPGVVKRAMSWPFLSLIATFSISRILSPQ